MSGIELEFMARKRWSPRNRLRPRWPSGANGVKLPPILAFCGNGCNHFISTKAFALVVDALLRKDDYQAAWGCSSPGRARRRPWPWKKGEHSFHIAGIAMGLGGARRGSRTEKLPMPAGEGQEKGTEPQLPVAAWPLLKDSSTILQLYAEDYLRKSRPGNAKCRTKKKPKKERGPKTSSPLPTKTSPIEDTTDDGEEGSIAEAGPKLGGDYHLEEEGERLAKRLRFLATLARLWQVVRSAIPMRLDHAEENCADTFTAWLDAADERYARLLVTLLDA